MSLKNRTSGLNRRRRWRRVVRARRDHPLFRLTDGALPVETTSLVGQDGAIEAVYVDHGTPDNPGFAVIYARRSGDLAEMSQHLIRALVGRSDRFHETGDLSRPEAKPVMRVLIDERELPAGSCHSLQYGDLRVAEIDSGDVQIVVIWNSADRRDTLFLERLQDEVSMRG